MRASLLATATINLFNFVFWALFILYAVRSLHVQPGDARARPRRGGGRQCDRLGVTTRLGRRLGIGPTYLLGCIVFPVPLVLVPARGRAVLADPRDALPRGVRQRARRDDPRHQRRVDLRRARPAPAAFTCVRRVHGREQRRPAGRITDRRLPRYRDRAPADPLDRRHRRRGRASCGSCRRRFRRCASCRSWRSRLAAMAKSLPWSWYSDPDVLRREQERIFRRAWQYVGHTGRVEQVGDRFAALGRRHPGARRARRGRRARVPQRLPPPRLAPRRRRGHREVGAVPVPRVDVRPRRVAPRGPALGPRAGLRNRGPVPCKDARSRPGGRSCSSTRTMRRRRSRTRSARCTELVPVDDLVFHVARRLRARGELEDRVRELPRVLPLPGRAQGLQRRLRRRPGRVPAGADRASTSCPSSRSRAREGEAQFHFVWPNLRLERATRARRTSRSGRCCPAGPERSTGFLDYFFAADADARVGRGAARVRPPGGRRGPCSRRARPERRALGDRRGGPAPGGERAARRALPGARDSRGRVSADPSFVDPPQGRILWG